MSIYVNLCYGKNVALQQYVKSHSVIMIKSLDAVLYFL